MKRFYVCKSTAMFYSAIVEAESKEEAERIFMDMSPDQCEQEETEFTLCEYDTYEVMDEQ